ncbi:MAG: ATP-binding protein, partial [Synechococcaceae cyanobacterium]
LTSQLLGGDLLRAVVLGLKDAVVAVLSTALGLAAFLLCRAWRQRGEPGRLSVRGLTFAVVLLAVSLPAVVSLISLSSQLKVTVLQGQRQRLEMVAALVTAQVLAQAQPPGAGLPDGLAARWQPPQGLEGSSDPALFARLDRDFRPFGSGRLAPSGLTLLVPREADLPLLAHRQGYWLARAGSTTVVQPAWPLIRRLDAELVFHCLTQLALILLLAVALAELLASGVERQLARMIRPLQEQPEAGQASELADSAIAELQELVELVNGRGRRARELSASLQRARDELAHTALAITEAIPVGTYTTVQRPGEQQARFSFLSDRFLEICGLERHVLQGAEVARAFTCLHPEDQATFLSLEQEASAGRRPFRGQGRVLVDGSIRWVRAESLPRDLPDGSTIWEGVLSDVTDEVVARQLLEAQQQQLRRILDFLPVAVGINRLEPPQEIVYMNRQFRETFGYRPEELPDVEAWSALAYDDPDYREMIAGQWREGLQLLASGGTLPPIEVSLLCRDRSRRDVILTATRLEDLMLCTFLDVTERKQAAAALERALRRETELQERQRRELEAKLRTSLTAAAVAHEINQPLSAILINTQMLQDQLDQLPEGELRRSLRPLLELQLRETERIVDTIERMRMLLRNVRTDQQRIDLCEVVESARLYLAGLLSSQAVAVEESGLDQPRWLLGDGAQLQIAVANLIRNAVEALGQAAVERPLVRLSLERRRDGEGGDWLELRIADNGPGFADLTRDQLLLASTKAGGSGIGLFVAATAVENHGGSLELGRSRDLGGAEVVVRLPALPDAGP